MYCSVEEGWWEGSLNGKTGMFPSNFTKEMLTVLLLYIALLLSYCVCVQDCADAGWWLGELNGKQGVFPDNFVKLFIPEIEKEVRSIFSDIPTHTHTHTQLPTKHITGNTQSHLHISLVCCSFWHSA
uniref:SH3 domain-containing protein n=1 Tax=Pygocentrus nattereri TaxID=42514 RepID=A0AAR2KH14_PYGNA